MNKILKFVYEGVKNSPAIKFVSRNIYKMGYDMLTVPDSRFINPIFANEEYFFGLYSCGPFSHDESPILANLFTFSLRVPYGGDALKVGYSDLVEDGQMDGFYKIEESLDYLYSPKRYRTKDFLKHIACDLYFRVFPYISWVCFGSPFTGKRYFCIMSLAKKEGKG